MIKERVDTINAIVDSRVSEAVPKPTVDVKTTGRFGYPEKVNYTWIENQREEKKAVISIGKRLEFVYNTSLCMVRCSADPVVLAWLASDYLDSMFPEPTRVGDKKMLPHINSVYDEVDFEITPKKMKTSTFPYDYGGTVASQIGIYKRRQPLIDCWELARIHKLLDDTEKHQKEWAEKHESD